jgi:hypothetical protein
MLKPPIKASRRPAWAQSYAAKRPKAHINQPHMAHTTWCCNTTGQSPQTSRFGMTTREAGFRRHRHGHASSLPAHAAASQPEFTLFRQM